MLKVVIGANGRASGGEWKVSHSCKVVMVSWIALYSHLVADADELTGRRHRKFVFNILREIRRSAPK